MRPAAIFAVSLTALALTVSPMARAEPSPEDWFSKALSGNGVNYQNRVPFEEVVAEGRMVCAELDRSPGHTTYQAAVESIVAKGVFTEKEADGIGSSAVAAFCPDHNDSLFA
jgi:uncharacterized protein DUF732